MHGVDGSALAERVREALAWTGLAPRGGDRVKGFSGGMKRRLNIACGILHRPEVILLDEPTVGVDPQSRERIWEMLGGLKGRGASLLLTTHQLEEAEARAERIVIMDHGRTIASGTLRELIDSTLGPSRTLRVRLAQPLAAPPAGFVPDGDPSSIAATMREPLADLAAALAALRAAGAAIDELRLESPSLHGVFLHLTGRELRE